MAEDAVFRVAGLRKSFGPIQVLGGVDLELRSGEVIVLMGANGAGKSTLVKIVSGVYQRDGGQMTLAGADYRPASPAEAMRAGVVTVHQNINDGVVASLDVATNLTLDRLNGAGAPLLLNPRRIRREARAVAERMGLNIDLGAAIADLSLADRQMVAIARAMAHEPKVLILDEPTSSLSSAEASRLFALIDRLRDRGVAILYISHRMSDIRRLADRIISLRDGQIAGVFAERPLDYEAAVNAMLGQAMGRRTIEPRAATRTVFSAEGLRLAEGARPFSLGLGDGEVVAITGLVGVGKTALAETLFGARRPLGGTMVLNGAPYAPASPGEAIASGAHLVAKDRSENGIVRDFNVYENMSLPFLRRLSAFGISRRRAERALARKQIAELGIVCRSERDDMATLSGGNQQKVILGRWLENNSAILVLAEPTRGVDVGARAEIYEVLDKLADQGMALLVISTDAEEILRIADRIVVMSDGRVTDTMPRAGASLARLASSAAAEVPAV